MDDVYCLHTGCPHYEPRSAGVTSDQMRDERGWIMVGDRGWLCPEHAREQSRFEQQGDDVSRVERPIKRHGLGSFSLPDPPARPQNVESTEPRPHDSKVEENYCHFPKCPNQDIYVGGNGTDTPADTLRKWGWDESSGVWMCTNHSPWEVKQARRGKASATQQQVKARRKGVAIVIAVLAVIVLIIIGANSGGVGSNNASYKAGFRASVSYSGINLGGPNASYTCGQLWTQVSRNYNRDDWMSGCKDGINS